MLAQKLFIARLALSPHNRLFSTTTISMVKRHSPPPPSPSTTNDIIPQVKKIKVKTEDNDSFMHHLVKNEAPIKTEGTIADLLHHPQNNSHGKTGTSLVWFRTDLRIQDNPALYNATQAGHPVIALFLISPHEWSSHDMAPAKADFLLRNLTSLRASLAALSIPLMVHTANSIPSIPHLLRDICGTCHVKHVFWNVEFEVDEQRRDKATRQVLTESGIAVDEFIDQTVLEPGTIRSKEGKVYTVYSPFMRSWIATITKTPAFLNVTPTPVAPARDPVFSPEVTNYLAEHSDIPTTLPPLLPLNPQLAAVVNRDFPAGEEAAHTRVHEFFKYHVEKYGVLRDYPANPLHTSRISAYLSSGILSTRQLFSLIYKTSPAAFTSTKGKTPSGLTKWVSEVIWREFYRDVLVGYPRVSKNLPFKPEMIHLQWAQDEGDVMFTKWCEGQTGYPIVDAGMRQLVQTGYIPNRIRMIVASFLSKHLLIDWRRGERFFMQNLIDGDLANNNGGWQWAASTGVDPQPYFRIFNPYLQSQKFDQDGTYIRKWVPELEGVASQFIHEPHRLLSKKVFGGLGYPEPVVDHKLARERALKVYKAASGK